MAAQRLGCELVTESDLERMMAAHYGELGQIPGRAWQPMAASILAGLGLDHRHLIFCCTGAEMLSRDLPAVFRFHLVAPERTRLDNLVSDCRLDRTDAKLLLRKMAAAQSQTRKRRFGEKTSPVTSFDMLVNAQAMGPAEIVDALVSAVKSQGLMDAEPLSSGAAAEVQFQVRLQLARYGIVPPDRVHVERKPFGHPSEEVFANLLDFYRIGWDYEPRSFPLQWDKDGKVSEAFHAGFLPAGIRSLRGTDHDEASQRDEEEPQDPPAARHLSPREHPGFLSEGRSGSGDEIPIAGAAGALKHGGD